MVILLQMWGIKAMLHTLATGCGSFGVQACMMIQEDGSCTTPMCPDETALSP